MYDLKSRRKELGLTLEEVGDFVGVGKSTVRKWENGDINNIGRSNIAKLADALKISPLHIIKDDYSGPMSDISEIYNQLTKPRQRKVYNFAEQQLDEQKTVSVYGQTAAGRALEYDQSSVEEETVEYIPKGTDGALNVRGDSMEPLLHDGELLFFQKVDMVENGEIAVVEINGEAVTTKKVKFDYNNQKIILQSLNDKYDDMVFNDDEVRIIGKVLNK